MFFVFVFIIDLYFLIPAVIAQIFNPIIELQSASHCRRVKYNLELYKPYY